MIVNFSLSLFSALLLVLIFPRFDLTWLAPVALAPLLVACARESSWRLRFLSGWISGAVFWGSVCYWIQFVLEVHGGMGFWGGWGTFLLFALYKGLQTGAFAVLAGPLMRTSWSIPAIAAVWTGIEVTHGPLAFAWLDLGNAGLGMPLPMRLAPILGVYGLSFVFAMTGCAVALIALKHPRREFLWLAPLPLLFLLRPVPPPAVGPRSALVVQPNIDTEAEWTVESLTALERNLAILSRTNGADLIAWPEAPAPFYPSSPDFREFIGSVARASHTNLLLSAVPRNEHADPLNSALMVDSSGKIIGQYDKVHLVPFGEYVPPLFDFVNRITKEAGDFAAGTRVVTFPVNGHRVGAFICYESAFPDFVRQFTLAGAEVLMNLSNDGYFGGGAGREQHLAIVRMRAAENQRWILRATNDGITAMIDPAGRVTDSLPQYRQVSSTMAFNYSGELTAYTRTGDWFAWSCLAIGVAAAIWAARQAAVGVPSG